MSVYLRLFWEFFKTGLFAVGGGMATLPFLHDIGVSTGWYSQTDLMNMLAVSESTPGPIGINMATYVGFTVGSSHGGTAGAILGALVATLGEVTPSIVVILIVAAMLKKFRDSRYVNNAFQLVGKVFQITFFVAFYGLRPASTGLIGAACVAVVLEVLTHVVSLGTSEGGIVNRYALEGSLFDWRGLALAAVLLVLTNWVKPTKKLHPIVFIVLSAVVGVAFHFAGV